MIYTIGFTGKTAEEFFSILTEHKIKTLIDIRLNTKSQLSAFAKMPDLEFFLKQLCRISYIYYPGLAPSDDLLSAYRKKEIDWPGYETRYLALLEERHTAPALKKELRKWKLPVCLLCAEQTAKFCHRRLAAEFISHNVKTMEIIHL